MLVQFYVPINLADHHLMIVQKQLLVQITMLYVKMEAVEFHVSTISNLNLSQLKELDF
jgi:hypothetical protein